MVQFGNVLLANDNAYTVPQWALDFGPSLSGLNKVYGPNRPTPSVQSICGKYINIFTRFTNMNQYDILMTAVGDAFKRQTDISYKGEFQTLTKQSIRH